MIHPFLSMQVRHHRLLRTQPPRPRLHRPLCQKILLIPFHIVLAPQPHFTPSRTAIPHHSAITCTAAHHSFIAHHTIHLVHSCVKSPASYPTYYACAYAASVHRISLATRHHHIHPSANHISFCSVPSHSTSLV